jgi:hypothetical protein
VTIPQPAAIRGDADGNESGAEYSTSGVSFMQKSNAEVGTDHHRHLAYGGNVANSGERRSAFTE